MKLSDNQKLELENFKLRLENHNLNAARIQKDLLITANRLQEEAKILEIKLRTQLKPKANYVFNWDKLEFVSPVNKLKNANSNRNRRPS